MRDERTLRYGAGVDANNYAPASLIEVLSFFERIERARLTSHIERG